MVSEAFNAHKGHIDTFSGPRLLAELKDADKYLMDEGSAIWDLNVAMGKMVDGVGEFLETGRSPRKEIEEVYRLCNNQFKIREYCRHRL